MVIKRPKWISIMLCVSILSSTVVHAVPAVHATEKSVHIIHEEEQIDQLTIQQDEKEVLAVETQGIDALEYQWQLLLDDQNSIWVNIYDATLPECSVSYAVVKNLLDESSSTSIRCAVTTDEARYYSDPVDIEITYLEDKEGEVAEVPKVLVSDLVVLDPETGATINGGPGVSFGPSSGSVATPSVATPSAADKENGAGTGGNSGSSSGSGSVTDESTGAADESTGAVEETTSASSESSAPTEETTSASDESSAPAEETTSASDESSAATDETTSASDESSAPFEETTGTSDESSASSDESSAAADESTGAADESNAATSENTGASGNTDEPQESTEASDDCSEVIILSIEGREPETVQGTSESIEATDVETSPAITESETASTETSPAASEDETTVAEAQPETTAPETTMPETTAPETTAPETIAPETSAPENSAAETSAAVEETIAPETSVPETSAATEKTTAPETTAADSTSAAAGDATPSEADRGTGGSSSSGGMMLLGSAKAATEYVTITIKYLDESSTSDNEAAIYTPYVATIEKRSSFSQNVVSPTFLGFAPYYDGDNDGDTDESAATIKLNYDSVTSDIEIKVFYKPIEVNYAIRYFFQNVNDDLYTEDVSLYYTGKAKTGTIISETDLTTPAGDTTGFTKMYHIPESVAADGSTVFECYYDRNYYLFQFDLDEGYGVEPIYARYGTPFIVNDPVKHGYVFAGWDLLEVDTDGDKVPDKGNGEADEMPGTIPAESHFYIALWTNVNTTYTVVYWQENANDNEYSYWGYATKAATSATYVDGKDTASADGMKDAEYFTFNSALSDKNKLVNGDGTTIVNVYYTRNSYTITFRAPGICTIPNNHTHSDACYEYICQSIPHVHTEECLSCTKTEHVHDASCCVLHVHSEECCSIPYHVHDASCCTIPPHSHSSTCWDSVGAEAGFWVIDQLESDPQDGQIDSIYGRWYYISIGGTWYNYNGNNVSDGDIIPSKCGYSEHSHGNGDCTCSKAAHDHTNGDCICDDQDSTHIHGDGNCTCSKEAHSHDKECYTCGNVEHEHTDECKQLICSIPEGHTHTNACNSSTRESIVKVVRRKYQQSLEDLWPIQDDNGVVYDSGQRWKPSESSYYSEVLVYISTMPADDFVLTLSTSTNSAKTMNYYLQVLPGEAYTREYDGKQFILKTTIVANYGYVTKDEDFFDIAGFNQYASDPEFSGDTIRDTTVDFYYTRITDHLLQFSNNGIDMPDKKVDGIMYGAPLKSYNFTPEYPSNLEPNAYSFAGWYTSPGCFDGTEVDWETLTMPEGDIRLSAKWIPNLHCVNFFDTYDDMLAYEGGDTSIVPFPVYSAVPHGEVVGSVPNPERKGEGNLNLVFAGWFYIENGEKKAYSPLDMPINRDMNIFADWSSSQPQPYRISYVLRSDPDVKVADDSTGFAYGGSTRTFTAKAGSPYNQLYVTDAVDYNKGYFPTVSSHSITMKHEEDKDNPTENIYTFYYVKAENIKYTIRYVNKETNTLLEEETLKYTTDSVVTERFKSFPNMVPDAFYKRLVISVKQDASGNWVGTEDNVITFYYMPNKTSAYYAVHYMMEKLDAKEQGTQGNYAIDGTGGYEEIGTHVEGIGDVNSTVSIIPQTFAGFELIENDYVAISVVGGTQTDVDLVDGAYDITISAEGTELYIFYQRESYPYTVHYYLYNTTTPVSTEYPSESYTALYGQSVTEEAADITNYTCVSAKTQMITIRDSDTQNVIIFYYSPRQYVVEYIAVPETGGRVSKTIEVISGTDDFAGSTPIPSTYYEFVGWYLDEECTKTVESSDGTVDPDTKQFLPNKTQMSDTKSNIFYAKFVLKAGDLTISRGGALDDGQVFVYEVRNKATGDTVYVTVVGNNSVTIHNLPFGDYEITQQNDWSWRYSDSTNSAVSHQESTTVVPFGKVADTQQWLNGNSSMKTNQRGASE